MFYREDSDHRDLVKDSLIGRMSEGYESLSLLELNDTLNYIIIL
jgi:hypothetical protein